MQLDTGHFFVGDFLAFAIMGSIDFRPYFQAVRCGGVSNEADDYGQAFQGSAPLTVCSHVATGAGQTERSGSLFPAEPVSACNKHGRPKVQRLDENTELTAPRAD